MASHTENTKSGLPYPVIALIGLALAVGGFYFSTSLKNATSGFLVDLEKQGISFDPGKTLATIGVLLIVFPLVRSFFLDPLKQAIDERNSLLETTFGEAEELRLRMETMKTDYESRLREAEAAAREQIQTEVKKAQDLAVQMRAEASAQIEDMKRRANEELAAERTKLMTELRLEVVNLTLGATEKLLGENVDSDKNRRLVGEFIEQVGARN